MNEEIMRDPMDYDVIVDLLAQQHAKSPITKLSRMGDFCMKFDYKEGKWLGKWQVKSEEFESNGLTKEEDAALTRYAEFIQSTFTNGVDEVFSQYIYENEESVGSESNIHYMGKNIDGGSYFQTIFNTSPINNETPIIITLYRRNF